MSASQVREIEFFNAKYPDHWDTLQIQLALIASFFANLYSTKKDKSKWRIKDFIPDFEDNEKSKQDISDAALGIAFALGDTKTKSWAEKKMGKNEPIKSKEEQTEYKYPLESMIKDRKKLPIRLRNGG